MKNCWTMWKNRSDRKFFHVNDPLGFPCHVLFLFRIPMTFKISHYFCRGKVRVTASLKQVAGKQQMFPSCCAQGPSGLCLQFTIPLRARSYFSDAKYSFTMAAAFSTSVRETPMRVARRMLSSVILATSRPFAPSPSTTCWAVIPVGVTLR